STASPREISETLLPASVLPKTDKSKSQQRSASAELQQQINREAEERHARYVLARRCARDRDEKRRLWLDCRGYPDPWLEGNSATMPAAQEQSSAPLPAPREAPAQTPVSGPEKDRPLP